MNEMKTSEQKTLQQLAAEIASAEALIKRIERRVEGLKKEMKPMLIEEETIVGRFRILKTWVRRSWIPSFWRKGYYFIKVSRIAALLLCMAATAASAQAFRIQGAVVDASLGWALKVTGIIGTTNRQTFLLKNAPTEAVQFASMVAEYHRLVAAERATPSSARAYDGWDGHSNMHPIPAGIQNATSARKSAAISAARDMRERLLKLPHVGTLEGEMLYRIDGIAVRTGYVFGPLQVFQFQRQ